jgi:5-methylcytosine-specific restriction endonuclease McrA
VKSCPRCEQEKPESDFYKNKSTKDGLTAYCKVCTKAYQKKEYAENSEVRERKKQHAKHYKLENRPRYNQLARQAYAENKEAEQERSRQKRADRTPEQLERYQQYRRDYAAKNRQAINDKAAKRRARKKTRYVEDVCRYELHARDKGLCQYCQESVAVEYMHIDHQTPLSRGGEHSYDNCVTSCASCNLHKSDKTAEEFLF